VKKSNEDENQSNTSSLSIAAAFLGTFNKPKKPK